MDAGCVRGARQNQRQCGFAASRWTPQNQRSKLACLAHLANQLAGAEQMFLANEFSQASRSHPFG
jgi:hypothetical protein